jgi:hypothetical protein
MKIFSCMLFGCCRQCALVHFHAWRHQTKIPNCTKTQTPNSVVHFITISTSTFQQGDFPITYMF